MTGHPRPRPWRDVRTRAGLRTSARSARTVFGDLGVTHPRCSFRNLCRRRGASGYWSSGPAGSAHPSLGTPLPEPHQYAGRAPSRMTRRGPWRRGSTMPGRRWSMLCRGHRSVHHCTAGRQRDSRTMTAWSGSEFGSHERHWTHPLTRTRGMSSLGTATVCHISSPLSRAIFSSLES
jgi:hypothetical protein